MKVLIGVDPHKASVALAVVDEAGGELIECASFPQNRAGLRALERWAKRFPKRRWAVENAGSLGRHLAGRLAAASESVVDVPPKLSARVRVLSSGNARKNDELDALATALWPLGVTSGWQRSIRRPARRWCASFPRGVKTCCGVPSSRSDVRGRAYYRKKLAEGKSRKEALRCLKRRISDAVFKSLMADLQEPPCSVA